MPPPSPLGRAVRALLTASVASVPLTLTHSVEDFDAGVHGDFGLALLPAAFLLSLGYAAQLLGAILSARGHRLGHLLNLVVALVWLVGAVADHLDDVLFAEDYRRGVASKALEVGVMAVAAVWAGVSLLALRSQQRQQPTGAAGRWRGRPR